VGIFLLCNLTIPPTNLPTGGGGGLSDAVCVPEEATLRLPDNVGLDIGALVEPLSVAWHAISAAPLQPEDTALVLGGGPIGLAVVQCLLAQGVKKIIVSEVATRRQQFAKDFGAHRILNPKIDDVVKISRELTGGAGPDVVFDCAGLKAR
jgi:threonine dehydrogenase-like Zn-dependent dehydrogenase